MIMTCSTVEFDDLRNHSVLADFDPGDPIRSLRPDFDPISIRSELLGLYFELLGLYFELLGLSFELLGPYLELLGLYFAVRPLC